jgi:hypothetical protein
MVISRTQAHSVMDRLCDTLIRCFQAFSLAVGGGDQAFSDEERGQSQPNVLRK